MEVERETAITLALVVLVVAVIPATFVVAQTLTHQATSGVTYVTNSGVEVQLTEDREMPAAPFGGDSTFEDGNLTISGSDASVGVGSGAYGGSDITVTDLTVRDGRAVGFGLRLHRRIRRREPLAGPRLRAR
jgi:hypothetical protein